MSISTPDACYLCNSQSDLTDDHIPPEGFFPKPRPGNLITVRCCKRCNGGQSLDDEAFRIFAAAQINRSPAGDWIWHHKVEGSSFVRSPKLKQHVTEARVNVPVQINGKTVEMDGLTIPPDRANNFLIRITKGLIRHFHPNQSWAESKFEVTQLQLTQDTVDFLNQNADYDLRGDRVFRFWKALEESPCAVGLFAYAFYDASIWMVSVDAAS